MTLHLFNFNQSMYPLKNSSFKVGGIEITEKLHSHLRESGRMGASTNVLQQTNRLLGIVMVQ